jgi:hypothetical protein
MDMPLNGPQSGGRPSRGGLYQMFREKMIGNEQYQIAGQQNPATPRPDRVFILFKKLIQNL